MRKIAFDVMGNDYGVKTGVEAVVEFVQKNLEYTFILVGDKAKINIYLKETERIRIIDVATKVDISQGVKAARHSNSSMAVAINLVKTGDADIVISSGNSAIYLAMATLMLQRIKGVKRPAFMPVFPTIETGRRFVLLDAGANLDVTAEMLVQWATLGAVFAKIILGIRTPQIGLINIGVEKNKGKDFHAIADTVLTQNETLNYVGFIEPRNLLNAVVDVAVIDGYGGNLVLKSIEGTALSLLRLIKKTLRTKTRYKIGALLARGAFQEVLQILDYRNIGAAWVIGLNGLAIKTHGNADKKSYLGAFTQIAEALDNNLLTTFKEALKLEK